MTSKGVSLTGLVIQQLPRLRKYGVEHGLGQAPRVGVVATAVIRVQYPEIAQVVQRSMPERVVRLARPDRLDDRAVCDPTEGYND